MDHTDKFFSSLTEKPQPRFNQTEFFKDAPFVLAFDFSNTKLANMEMKSSNTGETFGWGLDVPENKLGLPKKNAVDMTKSVGSHEIMQQKPNNATGFQGMASPKAKGHGWNPA